MLLRKHYAAVFVLTIFLQFTCQVTKPFGVMFSSPDQTPQVPFMFFLIIHYFERPAPSVRLVKSFTFGLCYKYWLIRELYLKK